MRLTSAPIAHSSDQGPPTLMPPLLFKILAGLTLFLGGLAILGTALSVMNYEVWWVRAWDFPRYQLCILALVSLLGIVLLFRRTWSKKKWPWVFAALLLCTAMFQAYRIFPYTPIADTMSKSTQHPVADAQFSLMVANVLLDNTVRQPVLDLVREVEPDLVLFLETDQAWIDHLDQLTPAYPHRVAIPQDNTYGMVLYSKLPLRDTVVRFLVQDDVPSIRTEVRLKNGSHIRFYGLHPRPPSPQESDSSLPRDAELVLVAKEIRNHSSLPTVVAGDMNDVAWSDTTQLFVKLSETLDPRIGRGLFNTFHVDIPPLRVPLDHVFHTTDFTVVDMKRLRDVASDHYPMFLRLNLEPSKGYGEEERLKLDEEDVDEAQEKLDDAEESSKAGELETQKEVDAMPKH